MGQRKITFPKLTSIRKIKTFLRIKKLVYYFCYYLFWDKHIKLCIIKYFKILNK